MNPNNMNSKRTSYVHLHPFLRWAGGKKWLVRRINDTLDINSYSSYHEPFVGGGAMLFHLQPKKAYISDMNEQLMLTYLNIKDHIDDVIALIDGYGIGEAAYYDVRKIRTNNPIEKAAQFIYLNQMSYNGIYRVNSAGDYNVPWGKRINYQFDFDNLRKVSKYLKHVRIESMDFEGCLKRIRKNALVFLDPPYTHSKIENGFIQYNQKTFTLDDQKRLSIMIDKIKSRGAFYILTNADHVVIREVFDKGDRVIPITRISGIGGKNAQRGQYEECIFTNTNITL
ncbi:MAG: Dam family site-specific DNA-(adenine-N6)-methyltransferase [Muribaculaceae bacterium]|nr:Dam family site-specific DNA-(adenine-N6)-methyltransferase [Muribaculaceae bacterium]